MFTDGTVRHLEVDDPDARSRRFQSLRRDLPRGAGAGLPGPADAAVARAATVTNRRAVVRDGGARRCRAGTRHRRMQLQRRETRRAHGRRRYNNVWRVQDQTVGEPGGVRRAFQAGCITQVLRVTRCGGPGVRPVGQRRSVLR